MPLTAQDFQYIRDFVRKYSAISLGEEKNYLVESRLRGLLRGEGVEKLSELVSKLRSNPTGPLGYTIVEAMTTNETSFFRDKHPFEALSREIIPKLMERRKSEKCLTFWCAATSSGQEPYSLLMLIDSSFPQLLEDWNFKLICTDISNEMLDRTKNGCYSQLEVNRGLPARCW